MTKRTDYRQLRAHRRRETPLWKLEVEYEAYLRAIGTKKNYLRASTVLWEFLNDWPLKSSPYEFLSADIEDWLEKQKRLHSEHGASNRRAILSAFFNWMIAERGFRNVNPVVWRARPTRSRAAHSLSVSELQALWDCASSEFDQAVLRLALQGRVGHSMSNALNSNRWKIGRAYTRLRTQAGVPTLSMRELKPAVASLLMRLGREQLIASIPLLSEADIAAIEHQVPIT